VSSGAGVKPVDTSEEAREFEVVLEREQDYRFRVDVGLPGVGPLVIDEPPPLGAGAGPNASRLLAAAVGHCLSASVLFCLSRARVRVDDVRTVVRGTIVRQEGGRLRVGGLQASIDLDVPQEDQPRVGRCLQLFEDFCIVTASVRRGIDVDVQVTMAGERVEGTDAMFLALARVAH
jgi:organic hydroperoxide reductase OsmC/OhrA